MPSNPPPNPSDNSPEPDFPPDIQATFRAYDSPTLSPDFEARFWRQFEARRTRYRGVTGALRRVWELEIEGVAVWKLLASTISGGAVCALFFGALALLGVPQDAPRVASQPRPQLPETPRMAFDARSFYARDWEFELPIQPKRAPQTRARVLRGGEFSWNGSKNGWA